MSLSALRLGIIAALVVCWELVVWGGIVSQAMLPPPSQVLAAIERVFANSEMAWHTLVTLSEATLAIAIAIPVGVAIGILLSESRLLRTVFSPLLYFMFSIPKSIFLPVFILAFGIGFMQKVMFGVFSALFILAMTVQAAAEAVPKDLVRVASAFGATRVQIYRKIYFPALLPSLVEGFRLAMIFNITGVIFAEMYASRAGIGNMVAFWGEYFMLPELLAAIAVAASLSIVVNEALRALERRVGSWRIV
jgi:NitT/TauT family transport system permease protein